MVNVNIRYCYIFLGKIIYNEVIELIKCCYYCCFLDVFFKGFIYFSYLFLVVI